MSVWIKKIENSPKMLKSKKTLRINSSIEDNSKLDIEFQMKADNDHSRRENTMRLQAFL